MGNYLPWCMSSYATSIVSTSKSGTVQSKFDVHVSTDVLEQIIAEATEDSFWNIFLSNDIWV